MYTTERALSLTFNGMGDSETMMKLLDELDAYQIKATFFLPGIRVAEEPDIAREIVARGHEIQNNTLNGVDLDQMNYENIYKEIQLSQDIITKQTGITPQYVRTKSGTYTEDVRLAAAHNGLEAVVSSSLFLHNWQDETDIQKQHYIRKYINRGGVIAIDTEENTDLSESVHLIHEQAELTGYKFVTLSALMDMGSERKPLTEITGYDAAQVNPDYQDASYDLLYRAETSKKQVALTFDDWGTDYTITRILDILDQYQVKASFFLRADGVEKNPNLARAIYEGGHDVGNHTYSHPVMTEVTPQFLQEDIVKAHQVITEAIQAKPTMFLRPPTGDITDETSKIAAATGYRTITVFDSDPNDWNKSNNADDIVKSVLEQTQNGSFILLHVLDDLETIKALPRIIEGLQAEGYSFVRVSDLIGYQ